MSFSGSALFFIAGIRLGGGVVFLAAPTESTIHSLIGASFLPRQRHSRIQPLK